MSDQVTARLIEDEGEVLHAYEDHLGFLTIGVGRLIDKRKGGGISQDESRYLLRNDIARCRAQCEQRFPWFLQLDPVRQDAIVCMAFQLGLDGVAKFKMMIRALSIGDYVAASLEMRRSEWHKQTPARCERMARIMSRGIWE